MAPVTYKEVCDQCGRGTNGGMHYIRTVLADRKKKGPPYSMSDLVFGPICSPQCLDKLRR